MEPQYVSILLDEASQRDIMVVCVWPTATERSFRKLTHAAE